jgi:hypothetical protein
MSLNILQVPAFHCAFPTTGSQAYRCDYPDDSAGVWLRCCDAFLKCCVSSAVYIPACVQLIVFVRLLNSY